MEIQRGVVFGAFFCGICCLFSSVFVEEVKSCGNMGYCYLQWYRVQELSGF